MSLLKTVAVISCLGCLSSCGGRDAVDLDTLDQRGSYAIGVRISRDIVRSGAELSGDALVAGLRDGLAGGTLALSDDELAQAFQEFTDAARASAVERMTQQAEENRIQGEEFLSQNATRNGVTVLPSGLQYEILTAATGPRPTAEDRVSINYRGTLIDGTEFDASDGAEFRVAGVIPGFSEGIQQMNVGSTYKLFIPGDLGYGPAGSPPNIGPNATLIFEVELLAIIE